LSGSSWATSSLAKLRRAVGKDPGSTPDTWLLEFEGMPEELVGKTEDPSPGEWTVHLALTLYATHQQSQTQPMYVQSDYEKGVIRGIGNAVRTLTLRSVTEELEQGEMPRRLAAMVTAETLQEVAHYARQLVQQLRAESIPLDYARLAGQLLDYQNPYRRDNVRLQWAREFAARPVGSKDKAGTEGSTEDGEGQS